MIKDVLQSISASGSFAIAGLIIFVLFFTAVVIWTMRLDKHFVRRMSELPLSRSNCEPNDGDQENG
jgi:hypothetical protein